MSLLPPLHLHFRCGACCILFVTGGRRCTPLCVNMRLCAPHTTFACCCGRDACLGWVDVALPPRYTPTIRVYTTHTFHLPNVHIPRVCNTAYPPSWTRLDFPGRWWCCAFSSYCTRCWTIPAAHFRLRSRYHPPPHATTPSPRRTSAPYRVYTHRFTPAHWRR